MDRIKDLNLTVVVMDTDFYALHAINGILAWDRRTRVKFMANNDEELELHLDATPHAELPDVILVDTDGMADMRELTALIKRLKSRVNKVRVICTTETVREDAAITIAEAGAHGYLLKSDIKFQIAWAIVESLFHDFIITTSLHEATREAFSHPLRHAYVLPPMRKFPELTPRLRQALQLCVVEGMPADLAADEMGISLNTIRGYIKEGYRILETYDETEYPADLNPQERAFMRLTSFADDRDEDSDEG
ncbi:MAG TPA: sigma factor-like helix-turn-helix DNA-binding protein [Aggregatilineales bacterium]|nr:response regulator transcription factor [Anaerolineae bacterium]HUN10028.1 sigma factor-like helix-turn-helix DNA-binding protein [Aggregatilineales bacterium]